MSKSLINILGHIHSADATLFSHIINRNLNSSSASLLILCRDLALSYILSPQRCFVVKCGLLLGSVLKPKDTCILGGYSVRR